MMAKIIKFPKQPSTTEKLDPVLKSPELNKVKSSFGSSIIKIIWAFSVLVWPILKWVISIDCAFQFIRMLYFWNTAGHYAGAVFLLHFFVLTFLTYFVTIYKPKGI
jgi:hypothetical protein